MMSDLLNKSCKPCKGGDQPLNGEQVIDLKCQLHPDWSLADNPQRLIRTLKFKGYAKAVFHANLAAHLSDQQGHHADIKFGWGYCEITFTTHAIGRLSENDFICAAKFDQLISI